MKILSQIITDYFYQLMPYDSFTNTVKERDIEQFIHDSLKAMSYFEKNPELVGLFDFHDKLDRQVVWGLVKGKSKKTYILLHHHDIVTTEDYGELEPFALKPEALKKALLNQTIEAKAQEDLFDDGWIFGRGSADMRAAIAMHLALIKHCSEKMDLEPNVLFLSVPDEEYFSEGMRGAVKLLLELKEKYSLDYQLAINSEPQLREHPSMFIYHKGSVGKMLPLVYVKGKQTHVSNVFEGVNPLMILGEIMKRIEGNLALSEKQGNALTPPPTWSIGRDLKKTYDVSTPDAAYGMLNMLCLRKAPADILNQLVKESRRAFGEVLEQMDLNYWKQCRRTESSYKPLPWTPEVLTYAELYQKVLDSSGESAVRQMKTLLRDMNHRMRSGTISVQEASLKMVESLLALRVTQTPVVIIALMPPYYPAVTLKDYDLEETLRKTLRTRLETVHGLELKEDRYFMGISDLSYLSLDPKATPEVSMKPNMPLWNGGYSIPFKEMKELQIPGINIGPWGKDIHKMTERVLWKDVVEVVPDLIHEIICTDL